MSHIYSKYSKRGNVNIPRAKVGRRVFGSLQRAERYCTAKGLNPDDHIEYGDSDELKVNIQEIAKTQKAILKAMDEMIEGRRAALKQELELCEQSLEHGHPLERGYWQGRIDEARSRIQETYEMTHGLFNINEELEKLTGWRD